MDDDLDIFIATLIGPSGVRDQQEFTARNLMEAQKEADVIDPLRGAWVEVRRKPDPQIDLDLESPSGQEDI